MKNSTIKEHTLHESENRLRVMLDSLPISAFFFDSDVNLIDCNKEAMNLFGYSDKKECTVRFEVKDNGIGISPEALENLGGVFEQADNSIAREYGGMGLGLSLTKTC